MRWARPASLADATSRFPSPCSIGSTTQHSGAPASQLHRSALLGQLPMSSCACALKVQDLDPEVLRLSQRCLSGTPFRPATATGVLRDMVAKVRSRVRTRLGKDVRCITCNGFLKLYRRVLRDMVAELSACKVVSGAQMRWDAEGRVRARFGPWLGTTTTRVHIICCRTGLVNVCLLRFGCTDAGLNNAAVLETATLGGDLAEST